MSVRLIQVPYDSGFRDYRMGLGPGHLMERGAAERLAAAGPVHAEVIESPEPFALEIARAFELQSAVSQRVQSAVAAGEFPLLLAGNCNTTLGALAGLAAAGRDAPALFWFDAHGDVHTPETSTSGFLDGMAISMITGDCWAGPTRRVPGFRPLPDANVALIGARDIDDGERPRLDASAIHEVTCEKVDSVGADEALAPALEGGSAPGGALAQGAYLHIDLDVHNPNDGTFNGYQVPGGLRAAQVQACVTAVATHLPIVGCTFSAYDPGVDVDGRALATALDLLEKLAGHIAAQR